MLHKVIVAPDSFKGSLTAAQAADIIAEEIVAAYPSCEVVKIPLADGGEGSVETIISVLGGDIVQTSVLSPHEREIAAHYGITPEGTAILEVAQSSGITRQSKLNPMISNTYGFGQLILHALDQGLRDFLLCIGGSASTDGGCGMAAALGVRFIDENGIDFVPSGESLERITQIDMTGIDRRIAESTFTVLSDVTNPLFGSEGAALVFGPQKGASPQQVLQLDSGLHHLSEVVIKAIGQDYSQDLGAGAAGGLGFGCLVFLNARLESGIDSILDLLNFHEHLVDADLIITGEGKLDEQSFSGKALSGIMRSAQGVPIVVICGVCDMEQETLDGYNLVVFEASENSSIAQSFADPEQSLRQAAQKAVVLI